jgi:hypothetical protein
VKLDIRKSLMWVLTLLVGKDGSEVERWCPLVYEFLPDFCFICELIGHTNKVCTIKLAKGEKRQYDRSICFVPPRRRGDESRNRGEFICPTAGTRILIISEVK